MEDIAPCLYRAVGPRIRKQRTVAQALNGDQWARDIRGALTVQVIMEYLQVWDLTRGIQLDGNARDVLRWKWTSDKIFSTSSAYQAFFIGQQAILGAKLLHKARAPQKCKFFIWLVGLRSGASHIICKMLTPARCATNCQKQFPTC